MQGVKIRNGVKEKCPICYNIYSVRNDDEVVYMNIVMLYFDKKNGTGRAKCRNCKGTIKITT